MFVNVPQPYHSNILKFAKSVQAESLAATVGQDYAITIHPYLGQFVVSHDGEDFTITHKEEGQPLSCSGEVVIFSRMTVSHAGNDIEKIKSFIHTAITTDRDTEDEQSVRVYTSTCRGYFVNFGAVCAQSFDHIFLPEKVKQDVMGHIQLFTDSKAKYQKYGRMYKTSFLFTGVPGSGKTSLAKAIALKYKRPLYILSLTKEMTDQSFIELMTEVKQDSILLIEDIDSFFVDRQAQNINISFSVLLQYLDGTLGKGNGVINIVTVNHPERLDQAMIRPGRIDKIIKFDAPRKKEIQTAFMDMVDEPSQETFQVFWDRIHDATLSMSGIIDILFLHPSDYMMHIDSMLDQAKYVHSITNGKCEKMYA